MWGPDPGAAGVDGPAAFGFVVIFAVIGAMGGAAVFLSGMIHHAVRPHRLNTVVATDVILAAVVSGLFVYIGVTAEYHNAD
jgi:hypothetical protein